MFSQNDFFVKFDFPSGYQHVDIHLEHQKYLGFKWHFSDGTIHFFIFLVLRFGLTSACCVFTKVVRPLVKKWRSNGIKSIVYIDDGINGSETFETCLEAAKIIIDDINKSGFVINFEKSDFEPKRQREWLGTIVDTVSMKFFVPERKIVKLKENLELLLSNPTCTAKNLSKIAGFLSSMHFSLGPLVRFFRRNIYRTTESRNSWYEYVTLDKNTLFEIEFWKIFPI